MKRLQTNDSALGWHIIMHPRDRRVLGQTVQDRRLISQIVLDKSHNHGLLVFRAADTHVHEEVACDREAAGDLAQRVESSLTLRLKIDVGFCSEILPIRTQQHLAHVFHYILKQEPHHGTEVDPCHEASCLPDLVALRPMGRYVASNVRRLLPRVTREDLLEHFGLQQLDEAAGGGPQEVLEAALAAAGLPRLAGHGASANQVRRAVLAVLGRSVTGRVLAQLLRVSERTIMRLRQQPADETMVRATCLQVTLRRQVRLRTDDTFR